MSPRYAPFYCEENVFHLAGEPLLAGRPRRVVFVSNAARRVAMWEQRAAGGPGQAMLWDYHVVLLAAYPWEVWDLDTLLGFPVPAGEYLDASFRAGLREAYMPRFRVVDADLFVATFASDRSHMRRRDGRWKKPPPPWPPIGAPGAEANLMRFVDVTAPFLGEVMDLEGLRAEVER